MMDETRASWGGKNSLAYWEHIKQTHKRFRLGVKIVENDNANVKLWNRDRTIKTWLEDLLIKLLR